MNPRTFPPSFAFGVATSSYQIEGASFGEGRGTSIWDTFCRTPGKVANMENGDVACDHYNRWSEDLDLIQSLGVDAYRFSIAWPRILPTGTEATANADGLAFYDRIVDGLLERGITPWVTLYHWDLPQALEDAGGWPDRRIVDRFVQFADVMSRHLGDRVKHWITHNEPWVVCHLGYAVGEHAPGIKDTRTSLAAAHHVLLSHGAAVPVIRANAPDARVGITLNLCPADPASDSAADRDATRYFDGFFNRWYLDPLYGRGYPTDMVRDYVNRGDLPEDHPEVLDGDLETIAVETDFLGINYYSRAVIRDEPADDNLPQTEFQAPKEEHTEMGWEVHPQSLEKLLVRLHTEYGPDALYITENGASYSTPPDAEGRIRDARRQDYLHTHLEAVHNAIDSGAPVEGYFAWSLMDNFEWAFGYVQRFGLVWVDYDTLDRTPKDSALWYRDVAQSRRLPVRNP